jgi:hypothetical protein
MSAHGRAHLSSLKTIFIHQWLNGHWLLGRMHFALPPRGEASVSAHTTIVDLDRRTPR